MSDEHSYRENGRCSFCENTAKTHALVVSECGCTAICSECVEESVKILSEQKTQKEKEKTP